MADRRTRHLQTRTRGGRPGGGRAAGHTVRTSAEAEGDAGHRGQEWQVRSGLLNCSAARGGSCLLESRTCCGTPSGPGTSSRPGTPSHSETSKKKQNTDHVMGWGVHHRAAFLLKSSLGQLWSIMVILLSRRRHSKYW